MKSFKATGFMFLAMAAATAQTPPPAQSPIPEKSVVATRNLANSPAVELHPKAASADIPRVGHKPTLADFAGMMPGPNVGAMLRIANFTQNYPKDGEAPTERTEVYLGYDSVNLYVVWLCFDSNPHAVRAHMSRRENIYDDDFVELTLDTFHDQRHGLVFATNPLGVQAEGLWTEGGNGPDNSWDTVWNTAGQVNDKGFMVLQEIPFLSLRFKSSTSQIWGVTLYRSQTRKNESDFWPFISAKINGRLNQEGTFKGVAAEPGRNLQLIPYVYGRSFRTVDDRDAANPRYQSKTFQGKAGLDAKYVFHNNLVLDATANPDFSQIESDDPQNTVNQRFEVFFPEKRPFFLENANFFENLSGFQSDRLLFTRRIADPDAGLRLTGKQGPWNLGFFAADDRSPGKIVPPGDPLEGKRAYFFVGRVAHDIGANSSFGTIYTDREFNGEWNRVGGLDGTFKLNNNWTAYFRSVISSTQTALDGYSAGWNHDGYIYSSGEHSTLFSEYQDIAPGFRTETGFVRRTDIRRTNTYYHYYWKPKKSILQEHGVEMGFERTWDHKNTGVEYNFNGDYVFEFQHNWLFAPIIGIQSDTLRPGDFSGLPSNRKFTQDFAGLVFRGQPSGKVNWALRYFRQGAVNVVVPAGQLPNEGDENFVNFSLSIKPISQLQIDNTYIYDQVRHNPLHAAVYNNHIIRSKWNYQINRELSVRFIGQYNGLLANPTYSSLTTAKSLNFDFLITYLLHPGTAVYVGYNSDIANIDPGLCVKVAGVCDPTGNGLLRNQNLFINDGRQFFVKLSYLFRR
jgi:Domain of unknown function (DUF5916)